VRRFLMLCVLFGLFAIAWMGWRKQSAGATSKQLPAPTILKQPARVSVRPFDPANPPADMPPLGSNGEIAQCVSDFSAQANVGGQAERTDSTHALITINQVTMTLQLDITIWVPAGVSQRVMEHEQGHEQISEYYYRTADKLAAQIASSYMGKEIAVSGSNLSGEFHKVLRDAGGEITAEYNKQLNPNPTQLLYDGITDHARNEVAVQEAVDHALKNVSVEYNQSASADSRNPQ
jgi:hypothetical protein